MPSENTTVRPRCLKWLNSLPNSYFEISYPGSNTGKPDITGSLNGRYVAVETKRPKKHAEKHQSYVHRQLIKAGAIVIVAHSLEELKRQLEFWLGRRVA